MCNSKLAIYFRIQLVKGIFEKSFESPKLKVNVKFIVFGIHF